MDDSNPMSSIFHEKQEGSLCAQHCLNALLQSNLFTPVDLAVIAKELDEEERQQMAEAGEHSVEYQRFVQQPSSNFDDSGFFSIQVIQRAVRVWNLELIPFTSSDEVATMARGNARSQQAYICNFREHWFTIRRLGNQWFNLNSLLTHPELVSDTYLSLLLTQLQQEGYSIFIVVGNFPESEADQILKVVEAVQPVKPQLISDNKAKSPGDGSASGQFVDDDLARALEESKRLVEEDDQSLKRALAMSMEGLPPDFSFPIERLLQQGPSSHPRTSRHNPGADESDPHQSSTANSSEPQSAPPDSQELREKRLAFYNKDTESPATTSQAESNHVESQQTEGVDGQNKTAQKSSKISNISEISEEQMLELALKMSMEGDT